MKSKAAGTALTWAVRVVVVLGVLGALFLRPFGGEQTTTPGVIKTYDAVMAIDRDGVLQLTETLEVELPAGKHGISRIFDTKDPRRDNVSHPVTVESVERDGESEVYTDVDSASGTKSIRIGRASVTLTPGVHKYTIRSKTVDVFEPGNDDDTTSWWWDVVGSGWQMPIESARVTANLPAVPKKAECVRSEQTSCQVSVEDKTMRVDASSLEPFEPVTVRLAFPAAALAAPIGPTPVALIIGLSIVSGLIAGAIALLLVLRTHEKPVGLPVLYEPPEGIYPALGAIVLDEVDSPYALQATLFQLAERGLLSLEGNESAWNITVVGEPTQTVMTAAESGVLVHLGLNQKGAVFSLGKNKSAGEKVSTAQRSLNSQVSVDSKPYLDMSAAGILATVLGWMALIATVIQLFMYFTNNYGPIWPLLIGSGLFALVAAETLFDRAVWTVRNKAGREMWSRVGGFARFLTTDSSESRFNFAERQDLYPRYLPWALVLGSADAWAQRYREQGVEPPIVPWLIWTGMAGNYSMTSMSTSFNSAISSSAAAYAASQASSGGGGGFSGGSGGGGGGGGSW